MDPSERPAPPADPSHEVALSVRRVPDLDDAEEGVALQSARELVAARLWTGAPPPSFALFVCADGAVRLVDLEPLEARSLADVTEALEMVVGALAPAAPVLRLVLVLPSASGGPPILIASTDGASTESFALTMRGDTVARTVAPPVRLEPLEELLRAPRMDA